MINLPPVEFFTEPVIGIVLMNAQHDSEGNPILPEQYYNVAKDPKSGKIIILEKSRYAALTNQTDNGIQN